MSTINYPIDQDKSIESWTLTTSADQIANFGKVYGIGELIPVNYNEILLKLIGLQIPYAPLREYVYIDSQKARAKLNNEEGNYVQSIALATAMIELYQYWKNIILPDFQYPLGVVTKMNSEMIPDNNTPPTSDFHLAITLKIQWFKIPPSPPAPK